MLLMFFRHLILQSRFLFYFLSLMAKIVEQENDNINLKDYDFQGSIT